MHEREYFRHAGRSTRLGGNGEWGKASKGRGKRAESRMGESVMESVHTRGDTGRRPQGGVRLLRKQNLVAIYVISPGENT